MGLREAYQKKAKAQLCEWQAWIDAYQIDTELEIKQNPAERQRMKARLEDSIRIARACLAELDSARNEQWELSKQAVERAMIDLKRVLEESGAIRSARLVPVQAGREHVYEPFQRKG